MKQNIPNMIKRKATSFRNRTGQKAFRMIRVQMRCVPLQKSDLDSSFFFGCFLNMLKRTKVFKKNIAVDQPKISIV